MALTRVDRVARALGRLPAYLADGQRRREWITAIVEQIQELEDAALAVYAQRHLDVAEGAQLDQLGALVGEPRAGLEDADYRRRIRARIAHNRSQGLVEDVIRIARLIVYNAGASITVEQQDVATVVVRVGALATDAAVAADLISFLRTGVAAGVRVLVEYSEAAPADTFTFDGPEGLGFPTPYNIDLSLYLGSGYATVVAVRPEHNPDDDIALTLELVGDAGAPSAGALDDVWPAIVFTFKPGDTTIVDFEDALAASVWLYVAAKTSATGKLLSPDDDTGPLSFAALSTPLAGGALAGILE